LTRLARSRRNQRAGSNGRGCSLPTANTLFLRGGSNHRRYASNGRAMRAAGEKLGVIVALDDSPRPGRERVITKEARTFVVDLACRKPRNSAIRTNCGRRGADTASCSGTLCKILTAYEIKRTKCAIIWNAAILCSTRRWRGLAPLPRGRVVEAIRCRARAGNPAIAIISYDEKPGVQAIGTTAPDLRQRLCATIAWPRSRICSTWNAEPVGGNRSFDRSGSRQRGGATSFARVRGLSAKARRRLSVSTAIKLILDIIPRTSRRKPRLGSTRNRRAFHLRVHAQAWFMTQSRRGFFSKLARSTLRHNRVTSKRS